ncbi:reverse transcriptase domain-containing protein [Tanacetum coccineum]|uniref:Reverse transcriptase domain-containing protein n=1 Tax=Tanacetum coccineum TaxID=301880 RepID=A0ABQ5AMX0_9ASTR
MEAQYGKFLDMIRAIRINIPLVDVLAGMPNYGKFLKEIISNKHKIEQISAAFLSDESSAMIQNKVPPKLGDPGSYLIPCNFNKTFSYNALDDLSASINLMPYSLYVKLSLKPLKPTKISIRLADRSFQYPVRIAENMLVKVVGTERMIFNIDSAIKHSYSNDDTYFSIDVIDKILEEDFDALLDEGSKILYSIKGTLLEEEIFAEFDEFMAITADENSDSDLKLKPLPNNLEYVFLEEPSFLPVIISSQLSNEKKNKLISVLKKHKQAFTWKMTDIPGICPSFCKHKIQLLDDKKPIVQKQRRRMPFGLCNAPATFQRCMLAIFHDMIEESVKVFMDDFSVFGNSFDTCLNNLDKMLQRCKDAHLVLNWEKCHFMVKEGIVHGHKVSSAGLEVDKAKINGINFMGPFPKSHKFEYILGAIDYVSKWAEAQAFPTNDALVVVSFLKKLFCRFGMPKALISDRGTHFCNKIMEKTMKKYRVNHRFSTSYHPQISGQVENTNRALKRILKKTIKDNPAIWSRKFDDALWAFRTAYKTPTGTTAYKLIYGKNCHLPFEIEHHAYWAFKNCNPDPIAAGTFALRYGKLRSSLEDTTGPSSRVYTFWEANTRKEIFLAKEQALDDGGDVISKLSLELSNAPETSYSAATHFGGVTDWYQSQGYREPDLPCHQTTHRPLLPIHPYLLIQTDHHHGVFHSITLVNAGELPEMDPYEEVAQQGQAHPLSPAYIPDLMELDEHVPLYVLEYHAPSDDDIQVEDQPYADDVSPTAEAPGYIVDSDSMEDDDDEDPEEDPNEKHEPEDDDDDNDTDDEDEEHLAPADSSLVPVVNPVPSAGDTEAFETDESAPTPRPPQNRVAFFLTRSVGHGRLFDLATYVGLLLEAALCG